MTPLCAVPHTMKRKYAGKAVWKCREKDQITATEITHWGIKVVSFSDCGEQQKTTNEGAGFYAFQQCHKFLPYDT